MRASPSSRVSTSCMLRRGAIPTYRCFLLLPANTPKRNYKTSNRYGLGIRRFRNNGSLGSADGRSAAVAAAAAAVAGAATGALETTNTAIDSSENGVSITVHGSKRGERHPGGKSSVAQCFEQVPSMFFESSFSLQVRYKYCFTVVTDRGVKWGGGKRGCGGEMAGCSV